MNQIILLVGVVIMICVLMGRVTSRLAVPSLLIFIGLGMLFGEDGIFRIVFDDYGVTETICSVSLIFIIFYGGFGTNVKEAKSVAAKALLLSTLGVALTTGFVGVFVHLALHLPWLESFLVGSVIASTDAASVFNILRTKKLDLKYHTASLLELESGSNDPVSYMLTVVFLVMMSGKEVSLPLMLAQQIGFGLLCGAAAGRLAVWCMDRFSFQIEEGNTIFAVAAMLVSYALPQVIGGNGYLAVYLCGIIMGNSRIPEKRNLMHVFDTVTGIAQMMILRGEEKRIPNGDTLLLAGDLLILAAPEFTEGENLILRERTTVKGDKWTGKTLKEVPLSKGTLVVSVRRGEETLIPVGDTRIQEGDTLIIAKY